MTLTVYLEGPTKASRQLSPLTTRMLELGQASWHTTLAASTRGQAVSRAGRTPRQRALPERRGSPSDHPETAWLPETQCPWGPGPALWCSGCRRSPTPGAGRAHSDLPLGECWAVLRSHLAPWVYE